MDLDFSSLNVVSHPGESPEAATAETTATGSTGTAETATATSTDAGSTSTVDTGATSTATTAEATSAAETASAGSQAATTGTPAPPAPTTTAAAETAPEPKEAPAAPAKPQYANEFVAKFDDYVAKGGDPLTFLQTQSANYDEMPEADLVRKTLAAQYPDATADELDLLFEDKYTLDEDLYDERQVALAKLKLRTDATQARTTLKAEQASLAIPAPVAQAEAQAEAARAELQAWSDAVQPVLNQLTTLEIPYGEAGEKLSYTLTDKSGLSALAQNPANVFARWTNPDGTTNATKFFADMATLDHLPALIAKSVADGRSKGVEVVVDKLENPSTPAEKAPAVAGDDFWGRVIGGYDKHRAARGR